MLKFTNATDALKGEPLYINPTYIAAVFEVATNGGSLKTIIYGGPTGVTWEVEEGLSTVLAIIGGYN